MITHVKSNIALIIVRDTFVLLILALSLLPPLYIFFSSFRPNTEIVTGLLTFHSLPTFKNYATAFIMAPLFRLYMNSVIITTVSVLLNICIAGMAAYPVARSQFRAKNLVKGIFASILIIPASALLIPLFQTLNTLSLYNTLTGLIIVHTGLGLATSFFIITSYYITIPKELEEAACIDGLNYPQSLFNIIAPISRPAFATAAVLQFLLSWNEFTFSLILSTGNNARTITTALYYFTSQFANDYGALFAATSLIALPSVIIFILLQKLVIAGLTSGAVKG